MITASLAARDTLSALGAPTFRNVTLHLASASMDDMMQHTPDTHLGIADGSTKARDGVANAFDKAANRLHDSADGMGGRVTGIADRTANALDATGKYVRDFSTRNVIDDLSTVAKNHPGKSLIAAATLGLLVGRALMRPRD